MTRPGPARPGAPTRRAGYTRPSPGQYRRRRLAAGLAVLGVVAALGVGVRVLIYDAGLADVEVVRVTGVVAVPAEDVVAAAAVPLGVPLAGVDTGAIRDRVMGLRPIASVQVSLDWPHVVAVEVTERVPVAATPEGELVDGSGVVYPGLPTADLPLLTFDPTGPATAGALDALMSLPAPIRAQVRTVDVPVPAPGGLAQVSFGLTEDRRVRWGTTDRGADKASALAVLLTQAGQIYDVTSPDLPTVRR